MLSLELPPQPDLQYELPNSSSADIRVGAAFSTPANTSVIMRCANPVGENPQFTLRTCRVVFADAGINVPRIYKHRL